MNEAINQSINQLINQLINQFKSTCFGGTLNILQEFSFHHFHGHLSNSHYYNL